MNSQWSDEVKERYIKDQAFLAECTARGIQICQDTATLKWVVRNECPHCEYNKKRAQNWREEAYRLAGYQLPERDPVLEEREACAKIADEWAVGWPHPSQVIAERIRARGQA
jgi:hypothetical protein